MPWHIPLDVSGNVARNWLFYLQIRVLFAIPMALIFTWLYNLSAGNLLSHFSRRDEHFPLRPPLFPANARPDDPFRRLRSLQRSHVALPPPNNPRSTQILTHLIRNSVVGSDEGYTCCVEFKTSIDRAGRVLLPRRVLRQVQFAPGDELRVESDGDTITLRPVPAKAILTKELLPGRILIAGNRPHDR